MRGSIALAAALLTVLFVVESPGATTESRRDGRIAFTLGESGADRPAQLAVMDADGKNWHALPPFGVSGLSWSPDGRFIAYGQGIEVINVDGRPKSRLLVRNGGFPDWSGSGRAIAFQRPSCCDGGIWIFNLKDRRQQRIVRNGRSPSWSPDGRKLVFTRGPLYSDSSRKGPDLWVLELATKKERRIARNGDDADWSPDGRRIAFERCRPDAVDLNCSVYVMRADGSAQRRLFKGEDPAWSPNGQELAFLGEADGFADAIIRARLDGSGRRVLFGEKPYCGCATPDWSR